METRNLQNTDPDAECSSIVLVHAELTQPAEEKQHEQYHSQRPESDQMSEVFAQTAIIDVPLITQIAQIFQCISGLKQAKLDLSLFDTCACIWIAVISSILYIHQTAMWRFCFKLYDLLFL
jgi:hypothetical protein